jgi:metallo-beta-lactamase class B
VNAHNWSQTSKSLVVWAALALGACSASSVAGVTSDRAAKPTAQELSAKGKAVADALFPGLASLCDLDMALRDVNAPRDRGSTRQDGASGERATRPQISRDGQREAALSATKVFDDLHFLGNSGVAAWLIGTEKDGYVLIDALTSNAAAESEIIGGMLKLGLDPKKIRKFIISHGHGDHYGGHRYLSATLGLPVSMSAADWTLSRSLSDHPRFGPSPKQGEVVNDGDVIRLGKTEIRIYVATAHTPGTISPIVTVHDNGVPHKLVLWGGTGLNFGPDEARMRAYAATAARYRKLAAAQGVDIFLSNHPARDGSAAKMRELAGRSSGQPHPFVMGPDAVKVFDVLELCPLAQAERLASGQYLSVAATDEGD